MLEAHMTLDAYDVILTVAGARGRIRLEGDRLAVSPGSIVTPELGAALRERKPQLIQLLDIGMTEGRLSRGLNDVLMPLERRGQTGTQEYRDKLYFFERMLAAYRAICGWTTEGVRVT